MQESFITPEIIFHKLAQMFSNSKVLSDDDIYEWCFESEVNHIAEVDDMTLYTDVILNVDTLSKKAILPCNIQRLVEVYDNNDTPIKYIKLPPSYIKIDTNDTTVKISYYGVAVNEEGLPYLPSHHMSALETYCTLKIVEPDAIMGRYPYQIYKDLQQTYSNKIIAIKQSWKSKNHNYSNKIDAIRFNMLPVAAQRRLLHKYYS